jgi:glycosyltransferase involved in cell wall biosynthesis
MPPLVSVVIPTYNRWPMLGEAIESVLTQSYRSFELIVVDDGSTDRTRDELSRWGAELQVVSQPRKGVATARNLGVSIAAGRYIAFLDSDDIWLPRKLEIQWAFVEENPGNEICQTEEIWLRHGLRVNPKAKHRKTSGDIFRRSLELCLVSPSAVMLTKDLFVATGGFDETFPVCEDYDLWLRIAVARPVLLVPAALVIKRGGHADQLSRSTWGMDRYRVAALQKLLQTGLRGEKRQWACDALKRKISILSQGARRRGKEAEAEAYESILAGFEESFDVGRADSRLCEGQGVPPANAAALAKLG